MNPIERYEYLAGKLKETEDWADGFRKWSEDQKEIQIEVDNLQFKSKEGSPYCRPPWEIVIGIQIALRPLVDQLVDESVRILRAQVALAAREIREYASTLP